MSRQGSAPYNLRRRTRRSRRETRAERESRIIDEIIDEVLGTIDSPDNGPSSQTTATQYQANFTATEIPAVIPASPEPIRLTDEETEKILKRIRELFLPQTPGTPFNSGAQITENCTICLDPVNESSSAVTLPCLHFFCKEEIQNWLRTRSTCPNCNSSVQKLVWDFKDGNNYTADEIHVVNQLSRLPQVPIPPAIVMSLRRFTEGPQWRAVFTSAFDPSTNPGQSASPGRAQDYPGFFQTPRPAYSPSDPRLRYYNQAMPSAPTRMPLPRQSPEIITVSSDEEINTSMSQEGASPNPRQ